MDKNSDEFGTPDRVYDPLHRRYIFTWDVAATAENSKCGQSYWSKEDNSLELSWVGIRAWCNPPYSKGNVEAFAMKAFEETTKGCEVVGLLVPTRTEQLWFKTLKNSGRVDIMYFSKRIKFIGGENSARDSHMFLVIWPPLEILQ